MGVAGTASPALKRDSIDLLLYPERVVSICNSSASTLSRMVSTFSPTPRMFSLTV